MKGYVPGEAPSIVAPSETLIEALQALRDQEDTGIRFVRSGQKELYFSYSDLRLLSLHRAAYLRSVGLKQGDRVALVISDEAEFVLSFMASVFAGLVPVPISSYISTKSADKYREFVGRIIREAQASVVLTMEANRPTLQPLIQDGTGLERLATIETAHCSKAAPISLPQVKPEDVCFLQFTSGSVAFPRGVMITNANLMENIRMIAGPYGIGPKGLGPDPDLLVTWLPLFHDMGLIGGVLTPLVSNVPAVVISTTAFLRDPRIWLRAIDKYRGTVTYAPDFAYALVTKRIRERDLESLDLSSLRTAGCGAEPIRAETIRRFSEVLAPAGFRAEALVPSYGLAESTLAVTLRRRGMPLRTDRVDADSLASGYAAPANQGTERTGELVSCGVCFPGHEVAILDEEGRHLTERRIGEIAVKGPSVASGYFNNPEDTAATWREGWLHTGDLGYLAAGELFVCGRRKDVIIIRGANIHPQDIEWSLQELAGIRHGNVVAFGILEKDEEKLVVVAEPDSDDLESLRRRIAAQVYEANGLEVGRIVLIPAGTLPRTSSGKPQRTRVKELFLSGQLRFIGDKPAQDPVWHTLKHAHGAFRKAVEDCPPERT